MRKPIETKLGIISGRDAIYLDEQKMIEEPYGMIFTGEINGNLCSNNTSNMEWLSYRLSFDCPIYFSCHELDLYDESALNSSFDILVKSDLLASIINKDHRGKFKDDFKHFVLATYDYVYEIIARDFMFETDIATL